MLFTVSLNESASAAAAAAARVQQMSCLQTALSRFVSKLSLVSIKLYNTLPDFHARSVVFLLPAKSSPQCKRSRAGTAMGHRPGHLSLHAARGSIVRRRLRVWAADRRLLYLYFSLCSWPGHCAAVWPQNVGGRMRKLTEWRPVGFGQCAAP